MGEMLRLHNGCQSIAAMQKMHEKRWVTFTKRLSFKLSDVLGCAQLGVTPVKGASETENSHE